MNAVSSMTSKERVLATVRGEPVDHRPLCFEGVGHGHVKLLSLRHPDPLQRAKAFLDLGVDTGILLRAPSTSPTGCEVNQWIEQPADEAQPLLVKEYATAAGSLRQVIRKVADYPHESVPLFSDHHVPPTRSVQYLVSGPDDLDALVHILRPPAADELGEYRQQVSRAKAFSEAHGVVLTGTLWGVGDVLIWLSGIEPTLMMAMEQPDVFSRYVSIVAAWNKARLQIQLESGIDIVTRRGWYESTDFWSPTLFRQFLFEPLRDEIDLAHQAGTVYTYIMNSGAMPLLGMFDELGFDIYSNIDPMAGNTDLATIKRDVGGSITLYGGVNNNHIIERGSEADVRDATAAALDALGPDRFILGPGDSILDTTDTTQRNFQVMIDTWKELR